MVRVTGHMCKVIFCGKSRALSVTKTSVTPFMENIDLNPLITPADMAMGVFAISLYLE
jgi:hypothetical protein